MGTDNKQKILTSIHECIPVLEKIVNNSELLVHLPESERIALITAAGKISRPDKKEIKKRNKDKREQKRKAIIKKERRIRAATGIRKARETKVFTAPNWSKSNLDRRSIRGQWAALVLTNSANTESWSMERLIVDSKEIGRSL